MQRFVNVLLALSVLVSLAGVQIGQAAQIDDTLDLAAVPLSVQDVPENGYQVLTGAYLTQNDAASLIAPPRNLDETEVQARLAETDLTRTYVLDLVLPQDRAWQNSPFLAVVQTTVYQLSENGSPEQLTQLLTDFTNTGFVEQREPAIDGAATISMVGEGGDQLRTVIADGSIVIDIASQDLTGAPDETEHMLIVEATMARLQRVRDNGGAGVSTSALTLQHTDGRSGFAHAQQTGIHGLYRYRDNAMQPAIGELGAEDQSPPTGLHALYVGSKVAPIGSGQAVVSIWLGEFDAESAAQTFFDALVAGSPGTALLDPFFTDTAGETWASQGVVGVYRVTGELNGQRYSGNVEVRLHGNVVVAIGYRSIGAALPSTDITSTIMDYQLGCLESQQVCPPFDLAAALPAPQATPVLSEGQLGSAEFGWTLPELGPAWTVTEHFVEPGYDRLGLLNGVSIIELESVINHHGDPVQCVLDDLHMLQEFEEHSDIRIWKGENGETDGGSSLEHAWVTYRVEPLEEARADQEYVIRIDCFALVPESANLVMTHIAPVDFWVEEQPKGDEIRDAILLPESRIPHGKLAISAHDRRAAMIILWINRAA